MKFAHTIAAASVAGAALGLVPTAAASASTTAQAGTAAHASPSAARTPVVINTCGSGSAPAVRPRQFGLSCDGSEALAGLRWTRWTARGASGHGTDSLNDCVPDCAQGTFHGYPVHVNFWGLAPVSGHPGVRRYTGYSLTYTRKVPAGLSRHRTGRL